MISEALAVLASLTTLAMAMSVFVLPGLPLLGRCFLALCVSSAVVTAMAGADLAAWVLLSSGIGVFLVSRSIHSLSQTAPTGWQNWFVSVVTASVLWLLFFFLLWTIEETLITPVDETAPAILSLWESAGVFLSRYILVFFFLICLAASVLWNAASLEEAEK